MSEKKKETIEENFVRYSKEEWGVDIDVNAPDVTLQLWKYRAMLGSYRQYKMSTYFYMLMLVVVIVMWFVQMVVSS
jgi:glutamate dehydrogenase/leucine dehydrogenase